MKSKYIKLKEDKQTIVERVCPLCRVFGRNINLWDAQNLQNGVDIVVATCCTCKGLYHIDAE